MNISMRLAPFMSLLFSCIMSAGCDCPVVRPPRLEFTAPVVQASVKAAAPEAYCHVPFRVVGGPLRIVAFDKSCQCAGVDDGIVGVPLSPGTYTLPVRIAVDNRTDFVISLRVRTDHDQFAEVFLHGVVESPPAALPSVVKCICRAGLRAASGSFVVHRTRRAGDPPLQPLHRIIEGKQVRLSADEAASGGADFDPDWPVTEVLHWRWDLTRPCANLGDETIDIAWRTEGLAATRVKFTFDQRALVSGLVEQLYCGRLRAGETFTHMLTLNVADVECGGIASVSSDAPFVTCAIENGSPPLATIEARVVAPSSPGEFSGNITIDFRNADFPDAIVRVFGMVLDN